MTPDEALVLSALDVAARHYREIAENCPDAPDGKAHCGDCETRLQIAAEYDELAKRLAP